MALEPCSASIDNCRRVGWLNTWPWRPCCRWRAPAEDDTLFLDPGFQIESPERTLLVAELAGEVVGFASLGPPIEPVVDADPHTVGQMVGLYVDPGHWNQRIGSSLHQECIRVWQAKAVRTGRLEVWEHNQRARSFYERRGWRADGHRRPGPVDSSFLRLCLVVPED
jgi:ribosomal protein S18 acetylase RimI-like enzyme